MALLSFDQSLVTLHLHSGTVDAGPTGWRYGPAIAGAERRRLIAAFNGGFKLNVGAGGFESYGRIGAALSPGLGSIVTYSDGTTDIGDWRAGVPAAGPPAARTSPSTRSPAPCAEHAWSAPWSSTSIPNGSPVTGR